jgi:hypothetical protein
MDLICPILGGGALDFVNLIFAIFSPILLFSGEIKSASRAMVELADMSSVCSSLYIPAGVSLRTELSIRGLRYAVAHGHLYERTDGSVPGVLFGCDEGGRHGNFHAESYRSILAKPEWLRRLRKVHTGYRRARARANWEWKELDCAHSSDALLMNVFCYPRLTSAREIHGMLGIPSSEVPEFGFKPRTPLTSGLYDNTEIDMKLGSLLIEAKLTESDFQVADLRLVQRYRDLERAFDVADLPVRDGKHRGYQLIRGVLAAYATGYSFCVLCDARRPDLIETWYHIVRAVRVCELRCKLKLLTWQELAEVVPATLREFLAVKYGIGSI